MKTMFRLGGGSSLHYYMTLQTQKQVSYWLEYKINHVNGKTVITTIRGNRVIASGRFRWLDQKG